MQKNISLSACLIVKNEEKMLPDCLESIAGIANEIVVVDTGSEDNTISIAQKYKCKIIRSVWEDDFAKARNVAIDNASGTHILTIDADERLLNPYLLHSSILNSPEDTGGWLIRVTSKARRKDGGSDTYISNLLRLFVNHRNIRYKGIIHEQVLDSILETGLKFRNSPLEMLHLGYNYQVDKMIEKQHRNLNLLNKALEKEPNHAYNLYNRAKTYLSLNQIDKAEEDTKEVLKLAEKNGSLRPQALNYGGIVSARLGKYDEAITRAKQSLEIIPEQSFAYFILGESYSYLGDFRQALEAYIQMQLQQKNNNLLAHIVGDYYLPPEQIHFKIGKSFIGLKEYDKAQQEFAAGNRINANDVNNLIGLANVAFHFKEFPKAKEYLTKAMELEPSRAEIKQYLSQLESAQNVFEIYQKEKEVKQISDLVISIEKKSKPLITLSMIVKNEEEMLPGCIESVREVVDEIIIIDTGSEDKTVETAKNYGADVFYFKWINDFSAARNEALSKSTGEWILYLDADERLSAESAQIIRNLVSQTDDSISAYICTIESLHLQLNNTTEMHRGGYPRLFRNYGYPNIYFQGRVHEQITPSLFALNKRVEFSDIIIQHLGYDTNREVMEAKVKRNYTMLIEHVKEEPLNAYAWFQLGQTLANMRLLKEAEGAIRMALQIGELSNPVFASAAASLSQIVGSQKNFTEALEWAEKSLEKAPEQIYALFLKAYALKYLDRKEESLKYFYEVLRKSRNIKGVPRSGFDIIIPEEKILEAIESVKHI